MREIALDTETTGLEAEKGDRIVEIGCVELFNLMPTGRTFHVYLDPLRAMSKAASDITGLTDEFLQGKPLFEDVAENFKRFVGDAALIIHNAGFDMRFLRAEFTRLNDDAASRFTVIDTLALARRRFPGAQNSLDALCRRFGVDNAHREKHGALLDAELLAAVYLELRGGRQPGFQLAAGAAQSGDGAPVSSTRRRSERPARRSRVTAAERAAHEQFVTELGDQAIWRRRDS